MKTVAVCLKYLAILVNIACILFLVLFSGLAREMPAVFGAMLVCCLNVFVFCFSRWLIIGRGGIWTVAVSSLLNLCAVGGVIAAIISWGFPGGVVDNTAVFLWLIFPFVTLPAMLIYSVVFKNPVDVVRGQNARREVIAFGMKIVSVVFNILPCILFIVYINYSSFGGLIVVIAGLMFFTIIFNLFLFISSRFMMCGVLGVFMVCYGCLLNLSLFIIMSCSLLQVSRISNPFLILSGIAVLAFPLVTIPSLVVNWFVSNDAVKQKEITEMDCGGAV